MNSLHPLFMIALLGSATIITAFVAFIVWVNRDLLRDKK